MEVSGGCTAALDVGEGCRTPRHDGCRLPEAKVCPPPPRKKGFYGNRKKKVSPPPEGYFQPPDLELFFQVMTAPRREAIVQRI